MNVVFWNKSARQAHNGMFRIAFIVATLCWSLTSYALVVSIDEFSIVRIGTSFFVDSFNDGN